MIRRQARLRRDYLYRKHLEEKNKSTQEKKKIIHEAIQKGNPIPTELRDDEERLRDDLRMDQGESLQTTHMDDEYSRAGLRDPKILITTSRDPSSRLKQFAKEMKLIFPNSQRINRGHYVMKEIVEACRTNDVTDLIILHEHRGEPDGLIVSHFPYGPTCYFSLHNVVLRHDIPNRGTVSEQFPHLIFEQLQTKLGERIKNILKYLFPVPKEDSKRVMTFSNTEDYISFRHHLFQKVDHQQVELVEVGPRFELRPFHIKLGTVDIEEADTEWVLRPYMNTAKKRNVLL